MDEVKKSVIYSWEFTKISNLEDQQTTSPLSQIVEKTSKIDRRLHQEEFFVI